VPKKKHPKRRGPRAATTLSPTSTPEHAPPASPPRATMRPPASPPRPLGGEPTSLPRLLTVDEVADLLRTTRKAVYALVYRGALPGVIRLSRRLLIDQATLVQFLGQRQEVSLTTQPGDQR